MHAVKLLASRCAATIALVLSASPARAAPARLGLEPKLGYAHALTTGLSPYSVFVGLGVRGRALGSLWLGTSVTAYSGGRAWADGPEVSYRARDRAYDLRLDATWRFALSRWSVELGAEAAAAWIIGSTYVTPVRIADRHLAGSFGPLFRSSWRTASVEVGIEAAALYVPSSVAAPILRGGLFVVLPL